MGFSLINNPFGVFLCFSYGLGVLPLDVLPGWLTRQGTLELRGKALAIEDRPGMAKKGQMGAKKYPCPIPMYVCMHACMYVCMYTRW